MPTLMRTLCRLLLPGLLWAVLAAQLGYRQRQRDPPPLPDLATGRLLPSAQIQLLGEHSGRPLRELLTDKGSCSLLVVCSTGCGICQGMRATWPGELRAWTDSVGEPVRATWLLSEPEEAVAGFYEGYDFGRIALARLEERDGGRFLWKLGLRGTPTTYVLDRQGHYRFTVPGNQLPPADSMRSICR